MTFDQVVAFATKHGIKHLQFIKSHLDPTAPAAESLRKKAVLEQNGLVAYTFGVNGTSMDKEANRKLFEFAKLMGIKIIIVEPRNLAEWDNLEALVKEYDIKLAIHNHGKGSAYGDPATVQKILDARDRRIGVCLDIGWITAAGGAWNASIVAEYVQDDGKLYQATGLGALISQATAAKNFPVLTAASIVMAMIVVGINRTVWKKLQSIVNDRCRFGT